jgi:membrane-associated phospholipid phosphatase
MLLVILLLLVVCCLSVGWLLTPGQGAFTNGIGTGFGAVLSRATGTLATVARRWIGPQLADGPAVAMLALIVIVGGWAFFELLEDVVMGDAIVGLDARVFALLGSLRTHASDVVFVAITELGDAKVSMPVFGVALGGLVALARWRAAVFLAVSVAGAAVFVAGLKGVIARPRPVSIYDGVIDYSFPSGHACMTIVLYGALAVLLTRGMPLGWRRLVTTAVVLFIALVSFSRVYLGAHWMSDVLAGLTFGAAWLAGLTIIYLHRDAGALPTRALALGLVLVLGLAGGLHVARDFAGEVARYSQALPKPL